MDFPSLHIGELCARVPIIQGGMGIGISLSSLAGAVAKAGGIGVISAAQPGYQEDDFFINSYGANERALAKHLARAKEIAPGGVIGVNVMCRGHHYAEYVKCAVKNGADIIFSGAGLPKSLPSLGQKRRSHPSFLQLRRHRFCFTSGKDTITAQRML